MQYKSGGMGGGGGGGRGGRGRGPDSGPRDDFAETVVKINRSAKVVKGGRRFSFSALVVVGDRKGRVGVGYGKANEVPQSVEKGVKEARKSLISVPMKGSTIPHKVQGRFGASKVVMLPAAPGTGVIAGATVRAVATAAGVGDILTKSLGSPNPVNLVKAAMDAFGKLRTKSQVEALRGVSIPD
ncbi:MAG TPA: 30S ribosomal protein S5 [Planctomycetota bacterium]|nr:30S ribosomal protein S5 [Planctomycetota bacterium]